jgi:hypothetical protein
MGVCPCRDHGLDVTNGLWPKELHSLSAPGFIRDVLPKVQHKYSSNMAACAFEALMHRLGKYY